MTEKQNSFEEKEVLSVEKKQKKVKKQSMKKTVILAGIATLLIAALLASYFIFFKKDADDDGKTLLYEYSVEMLAEVEIDNIKYNEKIKLVPQKSGTTIKWCVEGQNLEDVDQTTAGYVITFCKFLEASYILEKDEELLSQYGLDNPLSIVTVNFVDGTQNKIYVGSTYGQNRGTYILLNDDDKVYVVSDFLGNYFTYKNSDLLLLPSLVKTSSTAQTLFLTDENREETQLSFIPGKYSGSEAWYVLAPTNSETNSDKMDTLFENISQMKLNTYVQAHCDDLAKFGFNKPYFELQSFDASGKALEHLIVGSLVEGSEDTYYCQLLEGDEDFITAPVYTIKADQLALVKVDASFVANAYLAAINIYWLRSGKIYIGDQEYTLRIDRKLIYDDDGKVVVEDGLEKSIDTYYINDKLIDDKQFKTFYSKILFLEIEGIVSKETKRGERLFGYSFDAVVPVTEFESGKSYNKEITFTGDYYKISDTYTVYKNNESDNSVFTVRCRSIENVVEAFSLMLEGRLY